MTQCETHSCGREATLHIKPKYGQVPQEQKLCRPCFEAWKSGAYTTGPGKYELIEL